MALYYPVGTLTFKTSFELGGNVAKKTFSIRSLAITNTTHFQKCYLDGRLCVFF